MQLFFRKPPLSAFCTPLGSVLRQLLEHPIGNIGFMATALRTMVASTTGASGSTCVPNEPRKSSVSNPWWESSAPSRRIFQDVRLLRSAVARTSGDSILGQSAHQPVLVIGVSRNGFAYFRRLVGESLTRMFGNGMVSARKTRSSTGVCALPATAKQCGGTGERCLVAPVRSGRLANSLNAVNQWNAGAARMWRSTVWNHGLIGVRGVGPQIHSHAARSHHLLFHLTTLYACGSQMNSL